MNTKDEQPKTSRPYFSHLHLHTWMNQYGEKTEGIAIRKGRQFAAHLTVSEALALAHKLADLIQRLEDNNV